MAGWPLQIDHALCPHLSPTLSTVRSEHLNLIHVALQFPPTPSPLYTLDYIDPQAHLWYCNIPQAVPLQMPFAVSVHLGNSDSALVNQFCVACLGLWRNCGEEKHFCRCLGMSCSPMYPGLVVIFFATGEWVPGNKRPPTWRQVAASSCKYS